MDDVEAELRALFRDAVDLAVKAKVAFGKSPTVRSQRGGPRLHPMFRVWSESVQNAVKLARALGVKASAQTLEEELDDLLRPPP